MFGVPTGHPYVFGAYPGNPPTDPAQLSDYNTVFLSAALDGAGQEVNISEFLNGIAKVRVVSPPNRPAGFYPILVDPSLLSLGSAGPSIVAIPLGGGGIGTIPEPASLGIPAGAALVVLRRRRGRSAGNLKTLRDPGTVETR